MIDEKKLIEEMIDILVKQNCKPCGCELCDCAYLYGTKEDSCEEYISYRKMAEAFYSVFVKIINQQPTSDGWIPVSERLPDKPEPYEEDSYLIQDYQIVTPYSAYWNGEIWTDVDDKKIVKVLAWQPLPQPFKESEDE